MPDKVLLAPEAGAEQRAQALLASMVPQSPPQRKLRAPTEIAELLADLNNRSDLPTEEELANFLATLPPELLPQIDALLDHCSIDWAPLPGPQTEAFISKADILGFGGSAGGGKTDLLLGVAALQHMRAVIFRRVFPSLRAMIDRSRMMFNPVGETAAKDTYNEGLHRWLFSARPGEPNFRRQLEFASLQYEKDVTDQQGQARDFHGFDELTEFTEHQFRFVTGWNRPLFFSKSNASVGAIQGGIQPTTARQMQRCRVVATMNPPTTVEGRWVIKYWAPWLDEKHPNPAQPGELRWFTTLKGEDIELPGPEPIPDPDKPGFFINPKSRTFIFSKVYDNKYLVEAGYVATLQALPEPLRSIMLYGDFKAGMKDDAWQVIPTEWVRLAQQRWRQKWGGKAPPGLSLQQLGIDVSRGGRDRTVFTPRFGTFFGAQIVYPGSLIDDGAKVAQEAIKMMSKDGATFEHSVIAIDVIGVGTSPYDTLKQIYQTVPMNSSMRTDARDKSGRLAFRNQRAYWWWKFREALDPSNPEEQALAIPDDSELLADLTAPTWALTTTGIQVEPKEDIIARIKRSPDKGESLLLAFAPCAAINDSHFVVGNSAAATQDFSVFSTTGGERDWGFGSAALTDALSPWSMQ